MLLTISIETLNTKDDIIRWENFQHNRESFEMAETSNLAKIENVPDHPMTMFNDVLAETKERIMCVASINE